MTDTFTSIRALANVNTVGGRHRERLSLAGILLFALALRLWFLRLPGYRIDVTLFAQWADGLQKIRWGEYYGLISPWCDYLPGYLYILAATGWLKSSVAGGGVLPVQGFEPWIKIGPIIADLVLAITIYALARRFTGPRRSLLAASLILLNPSVVFVGAVWGQVESIATALYMLALLALVSGSPVIAAVWAGVGFATKPQYAVFLAPAGVAYLSWVFSNAHGAVISKIAWLAKRMLLPVVVLVGTVQLLVVPFSLSLWPSAGADWTFYERVTMAEIGKFVSAGAFNFWGTQVAGIRKLDSVPGWFSLTYETWGYVLFSGIAVLSLTIAWKRSNRPEAVLWACFLLSFGFFEVVTKMHERYLFAAIVLLAALSAFRLWAAVLCGALSVLYWVNLWYMWTYGSDLFANLKLTQWASDYSVLLFLIALATVPVTVRTRETRATGAKELWGEAKSFRVAAGERRLITPVSRVLDRRITLTASTGLLVIVAALALGAAVGEHFEAASARSGSPFRIATVRAFRSNWQDSGVHVTAGDHVTIIARGKWGHQHEGKLYGPDGNGDTPDWTIFPSAPTGALLGRIGDAAPFLVGESVTFTAINSGPLLLVMNDGPKGYDDNRGRVQAMVTLTRP